MSGTPNEAHPHPGSHRPGWPWRRRGRRGRIRPEYLVPRGLAMRWTRGAEKQIDLIKRGRAVREIRGLDDARDAASRLGSLTVRLETKAGGGGRLFGSISPADIAAAVLAAGGPELDKRRIEIKNPIKDRGRAPGSDQAAPGSQGHAGYRGRGKLSPVAGAP